MKPSAASVHPGSGNRSKEFPNEPHHQHCDHRAGPRPQCACIAQETSTDSQLPEGLSDSLTQYGYEVDPSLLTEQQRERFTELGVVNSGSDDEEEMRSRIDEILVMDAGTATYVSQEMRAMMDNPTELQANAEVAVQQVWHDGRRRERPYDRAARAVVVPPGARRRKQR